MLSNIYLHEVVDKWFAETVQPLMKGKTFMARYEDDATVGCELKEDAERIMKVLALRFAKYGLTIHPEKTKPVDLNKPEDGSHKGKGKRMVGRKTDGKRLVRSLKVIAEWRRKHRGITPKEQHKTLARKFQEHYA